MMDLRDLYQEVILDHSRSPRNFGGCAQCEKNARGNNPLCGDKLEVHAHLKDGVIDDITFEGSGCAISTASASVMTEAVRGKTPAEVARLFDSFHEAVTGREEPDPDSLEKLGKLAVFAGVREFPMRVKCATLAWHTLNAALKGDVKEISTE
ncbi:MAG: SUF system NifU family Fe-S cluster assembly protein [Alphaproteobacteria bacterium]